MALRVITFALPYASYAGGRDTQLPPNLIGTLSAGPRVFRLSYRQLSEAAPLSLSVSHVIRLSTEEQMIGIDASRPVTFVANLHTKRYGSVMRHPRGAMSVDLFAMGNSDRPVAGADLCSNPDTAPGEMIQDTPSLEPLKNDGNVFIGNVIHTGVSTEWLE